MLIGEAWGEDEDKEKKPFVGYSGKELFRLLGEATGHDPKSHAWVCQCMNSTLWVKEREDWLESAGILLTNVFCSRPPNNKIEAYLGPEAEALPARPAFQRGKFFRREFASELERLNIEIGLARPNLIVCLGNTALWAVLGNSGISALRGAVAASITPPGLKVLPAFHPAYIMRQWAHRPILLADLIKAWREKDFPELVRPRREILVKPSLFEATIWANKNLGHRLMSVDIETKNKQITDIGFATSRSYAMVMTFRDTSKPGNLFYQDEAEEILAWKLVRRILEGPNPKLFQNGLYDLQYLARMGLRPKNCMEDTMLLHHSLFPEMQKSLGFMGSIYTNEVAWKIMRHRARDEVEKADE
jgi:uracil-DNA glycosylase